MGLYHATFATKIVSKPEAESKLIGVKSSQQSEVSIRTIELSNKDLLRFEDKRIHRSMSRAGLLMAHCLFEALEIIEPEVERDPFRVGIYCCLDSGPIDLETIEQLSNTDGAGIEQNFKRFCPPKQHLKTNIGMVGPHLGMLIKSNGPINTYFNGLEACSQAIKQCESDLKSDLISIGIIGAGFAEDDVLNCLRTSVLAKNNELSEGAAILVMKLDNQNISLEDELVFEYGEYGIATPLINYVLKVERDQIGKK